MPFGVRTHDEAGAEKVPGQADSAPANFSARRIALRATFVSAALFGLFYLNYLYGWIAVSDLNLFTPPAEISAATR